MVPLTACQPKQVVLIGDHMQLQPIVQSELAQRLGMKRSLFERYVKEDDMLTTQYRMVIISIYLLFCKCYQVVIL